MKKEYDDRIVFSTPQQTLTLFKQKVKTTEKGNDEFHKVEYRHLVKNWGRELYVWDKHYQNAIDKKNFTDAKLACRFMHNLTHYTEV